MDAGTLLTEIDAVFSPTRAELAAAFDLDPAHVSVVVRKNGGKRLARVNQRPQDPVLIARMRAYADAKMGGRVEFIPKPGEPMILCVNSRYVA